MSVLNLRWLIAALVAGMLFIPAASAHQSHGQQHVLSLCQRADKLRTVVIKKSGTRAPGRDICQYGVMHGHTARDATKGQKAHYVRALRTLAYAPPLLGAGAPYVPPAGTATPRVVGGPLAAIASCESGGNPHAIGGGGAFRGKYQFDYGTWAAVGGSGDPAAASEAEQDMRAAKLYAMRGAAPWPVCGYR